MALTLWWGFCQTLLRPVWGMEQSRGAGSPPQFLFLLSAPRHDAVVCPCAFAVCPCALSPHYLSLFIACLLFSQPRPQLYLISSVPHAALGPRGVPASLLPPELAPAAPGVGGPVASKLCPLWCHRLGEGGRNELSPGSESPGLPLPPGTPRLPEDRRARPLSRRAPGPRSPRPERDRCSRSIAGPAAPPGAPRSFPTGTARGRHRRGPIAAAGSLRVNCVLITG